MVYYRKYRPQLISELDLNSVREKLTAILSSKEIPHAFLFAGPKGLGKTSSARILAKAINCEKRSPGKKNSGDSVEPCNVCSACISITNGSAVDVLEIDAASNRGIDEIRDLRERIKFSPSSLYKKVYIIDEVHMLTTEAFNALLKTLEEPPAHVMFILATTETGKLPETIMSRVFLVQFEKPSSEEIARSLKRVAKGEDLEIEDDVIEKIGELSDGAFRDGAKLLEELSLSAKNKKITFELLESLYRTGSVDASVIELLGQTQKKDLQKALLVIAKLADTNADFKQVIEKMASSLHSMLLLSVSKNNKEETLTIQKLLQLLDEAYKGLKGAVLPQLPLEIAVIEFCVEQKTSSVNSVQEAVHEAMPRVIPAVVRTAEEKPIASRDTAVSHGEIDADVFKKLIDLINKENKILAALLRGSKLSISGDTAHLKPQSSFHLQKLSEKQNKDIVLKGLQEVAGAEIKLEFIR